MLNSFVRVESQGTGLFCKLGSSGQNRLFFQYPFNQSGFSFFSCDKRKTYAVTAVSLYSVLYRSIPTMLLRLTLSSTVVTKQSVSVNSLMSLSLSGEENELRKDSSLTLFLEHRKKTLTLFLKTTPRNRHNRTIRKPMQFIQLEFVRARDKTKSINF